jgi:glycosyltransferase involved in cell wall biosynthesis
MSLVWDVMNRRHGLMRVCFVTTNFPRHVNDSEGTFVWEAARAVAGHGHQVRVVAQHWPGLPTHEWMEGIEVFRPRYWWPENREMLRRGGGGLPIVWRESRLARLQMLPFVAVHSLAVARWARDCDVIHAHWTLSAGAAWIGRFIHRRPILLTLQGSDIFQVTRSSLGAWLTRMVLGGCDRISAISRALAETATATGIPPSAITVIPNGVNVEQFVPPAEPRQDLLLFVGTLIKRKGADYLLQAMPAIVSSHPGVQLVVIGEGPEQPALERIAGELGIAQQVKFVGWQPRESVRVWMQRAKLLVLPSVEEGLGVVLLEALACGTPIVGSDVGGIPDVVVPEVGMLVPPADPERLAAAANRLLGDVQLWHRMSRQARLHAESHYDWPKIAERFIEIYRDMSAL